VPDNIFEKWRVKLSPYGSISSTRTNYAIASREVTMPDTKVEQPAPQGNTIYDRALNDGEPVDNGDCALDKPCVICRQHGNQISIEINNEHPLKLSFDTAEDLWQALDAYLL
jgi:hypothetical protein